MLHYGRIVLLSCLFIGCSFAESNRDDEQILARIDELTVSIPHFENAFKEYFYRTGQVLTPNESTKRAILDSEFNTYVLAVHAMDLGLDETEEAKYQKLAIEKRVLTEEFLEQLIYSDIELSEEDLREYFLRFNSRLKASHIYASNKEDAQAYYQRLREGEQFETLAKEAFTNKVLAENGGDIGWFTTDELDIAFEEVAFNLKQGEFSTPVKTAQGYSIIKVTDQQIRPIITEQEFAQNIDRLKSYVRKKKEELAQRKHLNDFIDGATLNRELFTNLFESISANNEQWLRKDPEFVNNLSRLEGELITYAGFSFSVEQFIEEYFASSAAMLNGVSDHTSFEHFITGTAYRAFMVEQAQKAGIYQQEEIQSSIKETYLHYLEQIVVDEMKQSIQNSPAELYNTFQENADRFEQPLLVNVQRLVVEDVDKAKQLIAAYKNGTSFETLIKMHSINNEDRLTNGELGYSTIEDFGFNSTKIANLAVAELSEPITYAAGEIHVYKLLDRVESRPLTFDEARNQVDAFLTQKKLRELRSNTIARVKEKHDAEINTERLNALTIKI